MATQPRATGPMRTWPELVTSVTETIENVLLTPPRRPRGRPWYSHRPDDGDQLDVIAGVGPREDRLSVIGQGTVSFATTFLDDPHYGFDCSGDSALALVEMWAKARDVLRGCAKYQESIIAVVKIQRGLVVASLRPTDALRMAVDLHLAAARPSSPTRRGVFARTAVSTAGAKIIWTDRRLLGILNRTLGLAELARCDQVVLCDRTRRTIVDSDFAGFTFQNLGTHHLREQERPERVWQMDSLSLHPYPAIRTRANTSASRSAMSDHDPLRVELAALHADLVARYTCGCLRREAESIETSRAAHKALIAIFDGLTALGSPTWEGAPGGGSIDPPMPKAPARCLPNNPSIA